MCLRLLCCCVCVVCEVCKPHLKVDSENGIGCIIYTNNKTRNYGFADCESTVESKDKVGT